jgi:uncharacterized protein (TIGR00255 family)
MTGFGAATGPLAGGRITVETRSVNHKHLSIQCRLPVSLQALEPAVRDAVRARVARGHVTVAAQWAEEPVRPAAVRVDLERARALVHELGELKRALGLAGEVELGLIARLPNVIEVGESEAIEADGSELGRVVNQALEELVATREREGRVLAAALAASLTRLEEGLAAIERRASTRLAAERERLRRAVAELLDRPGVSERLELEIALLADKLDIQEEVVRLRAHVAASRTALAADEPPGRRLVFLGQEMLRETNTIGSKANDAEISAAVIGMKEALEHFREQVENLE